MNNINIIEKIEDFRQTYLGKDWVWRKGQVETIKEVIETYINKTHNVVIISAPTGSGKSLLGMCISWILNQLQNKVFILTSEISLQEQYEKDFKRFNLNWGSVKGINNYYCTDNSEKNTLGTCRIRNKSPKSMYCYLDCPYFSARDFASQSYTSLLNYSYWLIQMNYVNERFSDVALFKLRPIVICDEAHKITDIVQNHFSPKIDNKTLDKLEKLTSFFNTYKINDHYSDFQNLKINIKQIYDIENQDKLFNLLSNIELVLEKYKPSWESLKEKVKKEYPKNDPPKEWKESLRLCDWLKDFHCKIEDYVEIINNTSSRNIVKNPGLDKEIIFNCLEESYLMHKYFHKHSQFTILMSATFGDPSEYLKGLALKNAKYLKMDNNFNFEKSPIYYYNKYRMSYKEIERNLPWLYKKIDEILDKHKNENGIIHTVSYDLCMKIFNNISNKNKKRILVYSGTEEKQQVLEILKKSKNKVVCGPSLMEGLDLFDDITRFIIFCKIPYLSLGDNFVKAKMNINSGWYQWKAVLSVIQGFGRGIRHKSDFCCCYILDACFSDLFNSSRKSFPQEFIKRIKVIND